MHIIWLSLIWKEWHEHKWKLASIAAILWITAALALFYGENDGLGLAMVMMSFCVVPLASFVGLSAAANERSRGTMAFLQALPTPMWPIALAKLIVGLLTLILSVVLTLPLMYGWVHWFDRSGGATSVYVSGRFTVTGGVLLDVVLLCVTLGASFYIWSAAAGVNRKDEVGAGAVALTVMVGWYVLLAIVGYALFEWIEHRHSWYWDRIIQWLAVFGFSTGPGGFLPATGKLWGNPERLSNAEWNGFLILAISTATLTHAALAGLYVWRFGRATNLAVRSPQIAVRQSSRAEWLSAPRQSAISAIAWKQFRESGPLVLAGLAGVVGISLGVFGANPNWFLKRPGEFAAMTFTIGVCIGFAITLIVGIGVCFYDVSPQQNTFWRSRPINPDTWYWVKFFTGLLILITTLFIPLSGIVLALHPDPEHFLPRYSATALLLAQVALFSAAVATTCLVRHAVYGAILTIPLMYLGVIVVWIALKLGGTVGWINDAPARMIDLSYDQIGLGFLLTFVVSTLLGWLAMRNDWGWKSRY